VKEFCKHLLEFNGRQFSMNGVDRTAIVEQVGDETYVTIISNRVLRDQIVADGDIPLMPEPPEDDPDAEHDPYAKMLGPKVDFSKIKFKKEKGEDLAHTKEITCVLFSARRSRGVVATYRGAISISQICTWIGQNYRQLIDLHRESAMSEATTPSKRNAARTEFKSRGTVACKPLINKRKFDQELERFNRIRKFRAEAPSETTQLAGGLSAAGATVQVVANFGKASAKSGKSQIVKAILAFVAKHNIKKGTLTGDTDEEEDVPIPIDGEKAFSLGKLRYDELHDERHLAAGEIYKAPIFKILQQFMTDNPKYFGN
jgi:hypothetical protein